jgi:hypothetical protein
MVKIAPRLKVIRGSVGHLFEVESHGIDAPALISWDVISLTRKYMAQV